MYGVIAVVATAAAFMGCASMAPEAEEAKETEQRVVRVVYDESNGVRVLFDQSIQAVKIPCYDGAMVDRCYRISCKPPAEEPSESAEPQE
jgi:hypothetical protein